MSELQHYFDNFRTGWWATENPAECPCHGGGWALSEVDTWHKCRMHYRGQLDPLAYEDGTAPAEVMEAAEAVSMATWEVEQAEYVLRAKKDALTAAQRNAASVDRKACGETEPAPVPAWVQALPADDLPEAEEDEDIPF